MNDPVARASKCIVTSPGSAQGGCVYWGGTPTVPSWAAPPPPLCTLIVMSSCAVPAACGLPLPHDCVVLNAAGPRQASALDLQHLIGPVPQPACSPRMF